MRTLDAGIEEYMLKIRQIARQVYYEQEDVCRARAMDVEDLVQIGAMAALEALPAHDPELAPLAWYVAAQARWAMSKALRGKLLWTEELEPDDISVRYETDGRQELAEEVSKYLAQHAVGDPDLELLVLRYFGGEDNKPMTFDDLNALTKTPRTTLAYRIKKGRKKLARQLREKNNQ